MFWLAISITAYFLFALNNNLDKFFLAGSKKKEDYITYTFFVAVLGMVVFVLAPFGLKWPGWYLFIIALLGGAVFILAILFLYKALDLGQASRIMPLVGGFQAVLTLLLSYVFLEEALAKNQYWAFVFLLMGLVLVAYKRDAKEFKKSFNRYLFAMLAAFFFAVYYIFLRFLFLNTNFITGFLWIRLGSFLVVITFLLSPYLRKVIFTTEDKVPKNKKALFLANQGIGGLATILISYAVSLMSVALVNAVQGVQYVFVLIVALLFSKKYPKLFKEKTTRFVIVQKVIAVFFVIVGLWMLFV